MLASLTVTGAPAQAHNSLTGSTPADGARLARPPASVTLTFLSAVDPQTTKITVTGPGRSPVAAAAPAYVGRRVTVPLVPGPAGRYTIGYEVASDDGHPVRGEVSFTATAGAAPSQTPAPPTSAPDPSPSSAPAGDTAATAPVSAEQPDDGLPWWVWVAAAAGLVLLAGGFVAARRRGTRSAG